MKKIIVIASIFIYSSVLFAQDGMIGEIRIFAGTFAPLNWAFCDGTLYNINVYSPLYTYIGTTYGGDGVTTFGVPNLKEKLAVGMGQGTGLSKYVVGQQGGSNTVTYSESNLPSHTHTMNVNAGKATNDKDTPVGNFPATTAGNTYTTTANTQMGTNSLSLGSVSPTGSGQPQNNMQPYLGINYIICMNGLYNRASDPYLGEVKLTASSQLPNYWLPCDGRLLLKAQYQALFSLLGTTYGGDGITNFALPDLRGRVPISRGTSTTGTTYPLGQMSGTESVTLTVSQMAVHTHGAGAATMAVYSGVGNSNTPEGNYPAINPQRGNEFSSTVSSTSVLTTVATNAAGAGIPIDNRQSYNTIQYIICTNGMYPVRPM